MNVGSTERRSANVRRRNISDQANTPTNNSRRTLCRVARRLTVWYSLPAMSSGAVISSVDVAARRALDVRSGDTVRVWQKIDEGNGKTRLQAFEGLVLARKHGSEAGGTITVRKVVGGVGVERIFPLYSPVIDRIETVKRARMRRAKLYFIREKVTREARRQLRRTRLVTEAEATVTGASTEEVGKDEATPVE